MSVHTRLEAGAVAVGVALSATQVDRLVHYLRLLDKWNRVYNLTAVRNVDDMVTHHLLDSLAVVPYLASGSLLDVGSGAGLPGIPAAIAQPDRSVTLLDSNQKKTAFLRQALIELELRNVEVVSARAEAWRPARPFDVVISRAFAELRDFLTVAGPLCVQGGMLAAMKGVHPQEELSAVPQGYRVVTVKRIVVPGLAAERHLILVQPVVAAANA